MKNKQLGKKALTVMTLLSASLGSLQIQAQTAVSKPEESRNYQVLSEKITESYRDIAKWQFEVSALEKALDEAERDEGGLQLFRVKDKNVDKVSWAFFGGAVVTGVSTRALLDAGRIQAKGARVGMLMFTLFTGGFLESAFTDLQTNKDSVIFNVDSEQEHKLRQAIKKAKAEIKMVEERLAIQAEELNLDVKQIQALAALKDYDATTADVREEGRRAAAIDQLKYYEELPKGGFLHSEKGRH